jgi:hypothetical protein
MTGLYFTSDTNHIFSFFLDCDHWESENGVLYILVTSVVTGTNKWSVSVGWIWSAIRQGHNEVNLKKEEEEETPKPRSSESYSASLSNFKVDFDFHLIVHEFTVDSLSQKGMHSHMVKDEIILTYPVTLGGLAFISLNCKSQPPYLGVHLAFWNP